MAGDGKLPCAFFAAQKCTRGQSCKYLHDRAAPPTRIIVNRKPPPPPRKACKFFAAGHCRADDACIFAHVDLAARGAGGGAHRGQPRVSASEGDAADSTADVEEEDEEDDGMSDDTFRLVGATAVTYGAGAAVISVRPAAASSSCRVVLQGLSAAVADAALLAALRECGEVRSFKRAHATYAFATFACPAAAALCATRSAADGGGGGGGGGGGEPAGASATALYSAHWLPELGSAAPTEGSAIKLAVFAPWRSCYVQFDARAGSSALFSQKAASRLSRHARCRRRSASSSPASAGSATAVAAPIAAAASEASAAAAGEPAGGAAAAAAALPPPAALAAAGAGAAAPLSPPAALLPLLPPLAIAAAIKASYEAARKCTGEKLDPLGAPLTATTQKARRGAQIFSAKFEGVDESATAASIAAFVWRRARVTPTRVVLGEPSYRAPEAALEALLRAQPGYVLSSLVMLQAPLPAPTALPLAPALHAPRRLKAVARFRDADSAIAAASALRAALRQPSLGGERLLADQLLSARVAFPNAVYGAAWPRIAAALAAAGPALQAVTHAGRATTVLKLRGASAAILSDARRALERARAGTRVLATESGVRGVAIWSGLFEASRSRAGDAVLASLAAATGAVVEADRRTRELRLYGEPPALEAARAALVDLIARDAARRHVIPLPTPAARRAFAPAAARPPGVAFDALRAALVVEGDAAAAARMRALVEAQLRGAPPAAPAPAALPVDARLQHPDCPLCLCANAGEEGIVELECRHAYCGACFASWLEQGAFPLLCVACGAPVPLPLLRAKLGRRAFRQLLSLALEAHVQANADALRFCLTPSCPQIYATGGDRAVRCDICAIAICTRCHVEEHAGLTCAQHAAAAALIAASAPNAVRLRIIEEVLTTRCPKPSCGVAFHEFDGCLSLQCSICQTHFCGWCFAVSTADGTAGAIADAANHAHVSACPAKPASAPPGYFAKIELFHESVRARRVAQLNARLAAMPGSARAALLEVLAVDLADVGIAVDAGGETVRIKATLANFIVEF